MDLFDELEQDQSKKTAPLSQSRAIVIDDSLQTNEPLISHVVSSGNVGSADSDLVMKQTRGAHEKPLSVDEIDPFQAAAMRTDMRGDSNNDSHQSTTDSIKNKFNSFKDQIASKIDDARSTTKDTTSNYFSSFNSSMQDKSASENNVTSNQEKQKQEESGSSPTPIFRGPEFKDLSKEVRLSQQDPGTSEGKQGSNSKVLRTQNTTQNTTAWSDLPEELRNNDLSAGTFETSKREKLRNEDRPTQDFTSTVIGDELPTVNTKRTSINVNSTPRPTSTALPQGVNEDRAETTIESSTLWPFTHTVKKRDVSSEHEPKDESAAGPGPVASSFHNTHAKLDQVAGKMRGDDFTDKSRMDDRVLSEEI